MEQSEYDLDRSHVNNIVEIAEEENLNLSMQNAYLLDKLRKMKQREEKLLKINKKLLEYKGKCVRMEEAYCCMRDERDSYKRQALQFKDILKNDLVKLKGKFRSFLERDKIYA